ncbi:uncharacterized protein LOC110679295 [Aedes aegypti]|uniref:Ionotropic glutamate receptor L-glutamate and glycine-binding domain-containing protein n=1 Tax=Aedes aegypti TaxID=7159 RepID=A0A6I8U572_AEDAE|nr:ionotropic receptor 7m precursor [Aedes aegypti]
MKVWNVAVVIAMIVPYSLSTRLGLDNNVRNFSLVSRTISELLSDAAYRTIHFLKFNNDVSDLLMSNIVFDYNGPVEIYTGNYGKADAAVMIANSNSLESILTDVLKEISFLILTVNVFNQMEILPIIISKLRTTKIDRITVVSFDSEGAVVNISTLFRHKTNNCENSNMHTTTSQTLQDSESHVKKVSAERSKTDFQGCVMDVGVVLMAPFTIIEQNGHDLQYSGIEVEMIRVLGEHFNFKIRFVHPPNGTKWGNLHKNGSTGLMAMLQRGRVDFAIGSIARTLTRNTLLKGGVGNFYDQIIFGVPPGIPYTPLKQLARPVTTNGWIFIIVTCIAVSILFSIDIDRYLCVINLEKCKTSFTDVWSILLGGVMNNPPTEVFGRYLLTGWLWATLVYRTAYQAILFGHLRRGVEFKPILTLEDTFEAGVQYYMYNIAQRFFVRNPRILMRSVIVEDNASLQNILADIAENKLMAAFPLPRSIIDYFNNQRLFKPKIHISRYVIESFESAIHYPIDSFLAALFDDMVLRIRAVGLHEYWTRQHRQTIVDNSVQHKELKLQNLLGAFMIHGVLCGFSCIIFLIELNISKADHFLKNK